MVTVSTARGPVVIDEERILELVRAEVRLTVLTLQRLVIGLLVSIIVGSASLAYSAARVVSSIEAIQREMVTLNRELTATTLRSLDNQRLLGVHGDRLDRPEN